MTAEDAAEDAARYVVILTLKERAERLQLLLRRSHSSPELSQLTRVVAISDIHTDHNSSNWDWLARLPDQKDALCIVAGDVSESLVGLSKTFRLLQPKFGALSFVVGNHDLWVGAHGSCRDEMRRTDASIHPRLTSADKLLATLELCERLRVCHGPALLAGVCVVPLFSWYIPGDQGRGGRSLYVDKEGEDAKLTHEAWSDHYCCDWPEAGSATARAYGLHGAGGGTAPGGEVALWMASLNEARLAQGAATDSWGGRDIVTFSHFLGREELIFENDEEGAIRRRLSGKRDADGKRLRDPNVWFNFSRVAGCDVIDEQARALRTRCHVHGHQHRQRDRIIDGVRYVSHCLAYPSERRDGMCVLGGPEANPKEVWREEREVAPPPSGAAGGGEEGGGRRPLEAHDTAASV